MLRTAIRWQPPRESVLCGSYARHKRKKQKTPRGDSPPPPAPPPGESMSLRPPQGIRPLALDPPPECKAAWLKAQRAWTQLALEPIMVQGRAHSGQLLESAVHVLGVCHGSPTSPRAVYEVASAVQPDALAYEGPRQMRDAVRRAASSTHLLPLLEQSMQAPIKDMKQAQELLSPAQLNRWRQGLKAAGLLCGPARSKDDMRFFAGGYLIYSDVLAVASIARKRHLAMAMIDKCLGARLEFDRAVEEAKEADQYGRATLEVLLDALQDEPVASAWLGFLDFTFGMADARSRQPADAIYSPRAIKSLAMELCLDSIHPASIHLVSSRGYPGGAQEANAQRERAMCDEILAMCRGRQPRKRILAVVGKAHVLPLRTLLIRGLRG